MQSQQLQADDDDDVSVSYAAWKAKQEKESLRKMKQPRGFKMLRETSMNLSELATGSVENCSSESPNDCDQAKSLNLSSLNNSNSSSQSQSADQLAQRALTRQQEKARKHMSRKIRGNLNQSDLEIRIHNLEDDGDDFFSMFSWSSDAHPKLRSLFGRREGPGSTRSLPVFGSSPKNEDGSDHDTEEFTFSWSNAHPKLRSFLGLQNCDDDSVFLSKKALPSVSVHDGAESEEFSVDSNAPSVASLYRTKSSWFRQTKEETVARNTVGPRRSWIINKVISQRELLLANNGDSREKQQVRKRADSS